jgi:hypothetical protein
MIKIVKNKKFNLRTTISEVINYVEERYCSIHLSFKEYTH